MPLPPGFPITPACNCTLDLASIGLVVIAPALSFGLGYLIAFIRSKDNNER